MKFKLELGLYIVPIVCIALNLPAACGADDATGPAKASYAEALTKAGVDRRMQLLPALEKCDKEFGNALNSELEGQNLQESNRIQALRALIKRVALEPWSALPPDPSQIVQSAKARSAEREFIAATKKADTTYNQAAQTACKNYIAALEALLHDSIKDRKLEKANAIYAAKAAAELELKLGAGKFPEGAILLLTFDHDAVSGRGNARALDLSGNGNDLLLGTTRLTPGRVDGGLQSTPSLALHTLHDIGIGGRHPRSVSFWLRLNGGVGHQVLGWGVNGTATDFRVVFDNSELEVHGCAPGYDFHTGTKQEGKQWHHHAITYDGVTIHWMIDGAEIGGGFNIESAAVDTPFSVGGFDGVVDEIAVYDRVLTEDEIKQLRTRSIW